MNIEFRFMFVLILFINLNCKNINKEKLPNENLVEATQAIDELIIGLNLKPDSLISYKGMKSKVSQIKSELSVNPVSKDSLSKVFEEIMINRIIPYWYGTEWSFEGHTSIPNSGKIACGYFVSTTLKDAGIKLNRYHLAQQSPINEAKTLSLDKPIIEIQEDSPKQSIAAINEKIDEGLYFIGFDQSHVGYLLNKNNHLYLIHSNYINNEGVLIENITASEVFSFFNKFYIVELSSNEQLLNNWIKDIEIDIVKN